MVKQMWENGFSRSGNAMAQQYHPVPIPGIHKGRPKNPTSVYHSNPPQKSVCTCTARLQTIVDLSNHLDLTQSVTQNMIDDETDSMGFLVTYEALVLCCH